MGNCEAKPGSTHEFIAIQAPNENPEARKLSSGFSFHNASVYFSIVFFFLIITDE